MKLLVPTTMLGLSLAAFACQKDEELPGEKDLQVFATSANTVDGPGTVEPYAGKEVFLAFASDANGFLYSAKTDANGYALFEGLIEDEEYRVFAQDVVGGNAVVVRADTLIKGQAGSIGLHLVPGGNGQNGFVITANTPSGTPRSGLPIRVYTSLSLAQLDQPTSAFLNGTADAFGRVFKIGIAAGTYYVRARNQTAGIDTTFTLDVLADGINFKTVAIGASSVPPTGLWLRCSDMADIGVPGLTVLGFANQALAQIADSATSSFVCPSIGYGVYKATGMEAGQYFLSIRNVPNGIDTVVPTLIEDGLIDSVQVQVMP